MRLQDTQANCGPASLSNALQAVGIARTQLECEQLCRTTGTAGTTGRNLVRALRSLDCVGAVIKERREDVALLRLRASLDEGHPVLLCVDDWEHWVAAIGVIGSRVLVADSADNELVLSYAPADLMARWAHNPFYGVIV